MMRKKYRTPQLSVELFTANRAIAGCAVESGIDWTFDCMRGPNTDTANVISSTLTSSSCTLNIGYASGSKTARDYYNSSSHSSNAGGKWTTGGDWRNGYVQVTYSNAAGLLYTDGNATTDASVWSVDSGIVTHSNAEGGMHHMVAPVTETQVRNVSIS